MSITTTLSISSAGKYHYSPNSVTVTSAPTTLIYQLDAASAVEWAITGMKSKDLRNQLAPPVVAAGGNSISVLDANTAKETFSITIEAQNREQPERKVRIDPEVANDPQ